jgi:hypothetical protein
MPKLNLCSAVLGQWRLVSFLGAFVAAVGAFAVPSNAQMIDNTQALNPINAGINKSLTQEIGPGRGSIHTPDSSLFIINRDAFRAVRRGRWHLQRLRECSYGAEWHGNHANSSIHFDGRRAVPDQPLPLISANFEAVTFQVFATGGKT